MPRVLTVDDSRVIRLAITKELTPLNFEITEAVDGNDGLGKIEKGSFDLVILDVMMPNLDGAGMLSKMRERGDKTPVLMLTSESKTATLTGLVRLGIADYVLKPFKGDELLTKVLKALKLPPDYAAPKAPDAATRSPSESPTAPARGILVIDDMENVHKKLRSMIPDRIGLNAASTANDGLAAARAHKPRLIVVDGELPDVVMSSYTQQLRMLEPDAMLVGMALRTVKNATSEAKTHGFDDVLLKPFAQDALDAIVQRCFAGNTDVIEVTENTIKLPAYRGREDRVEEFFQTMNKRLKDALTKLAEACYDTAVVDASTVPLAQPLLVARLFSEASTAGTEIGLVLRIVGPRELVAVIGRFAETKGVQFFSTIEEARAA